MHVMNIRTCTGTITRTRTSTRIFMAKGDGKQKRKKKDGAGGAAPGSGSGPQATEASAPTPMRVSTTINIPIRRQILYGRMNRQFQKSGSTSFRQTKKMVRTKYRRTWDEQEIEQKAEERRRKGQDPDWDVVLNQTVASPLVLVDGYNVIYKWPRLKKHMLKGDTSRARQMLVDDLESLRSLKGWRIEVVFDGAGKNFKSGPLGNTRQRRATAADKAVSKDVSKHGVRTVYTGSGIEADSYIEARCAEAKNVTNGSKTGTFIVATDDAMIRLAGESAGALCMSSERFVNELKAVKKSVAHRVEAAMSKVNGQAMRPEKLWGTNVFTTSNVNVHVNANPQRNNIANGTLKRSDKKSNPASDDSSSPSPPVEGAQETSDGRFIYTGRFGRGSLIIEDRRKKQPKKKDGTQ